jgi:hypothetical protein
MTSHLHLSPAHHRSQSRGRMQAVMTPEYHAAVFWLSGLADQALDFSFGSTLLQRSIGSSVSRRQWPKSRIYLTRHDYVVWTL